MVDLTSMMVPQIVQGPAETPPAFVHLLGRVKWNRLRPAVQARFLERSRPVTYLGQAQLKASLTGQVLALVVIALGRPLPVHTGLCEARIELEPIAGGVIWNRLYRKPGQPWERVRSVKRMRQGHLHECAGPVAMRLIVDERDGALTFTSQGFWVTALGLRLRLPDWLTPGQIVVTHEDLSPGRFRFTLTCQHPLLGPLFHQVADFDDPEFTPKQGGCDDD